MTKLKIFNNRVYKLTPDGKIDMPVHEVDERRDTIILIKEILKKEKEEQEGDLNPEIIRGIDGSSTVSIKGDSLFKFSRDKPNLLPEHPLYNIENKFGHKPQAFDSEGNPVSKYLFKQGEVVIFKDPHGPDLNPGRGEEVEYTVKPRFKYGHDAKEKKYDLNQKYKHRKRGPWDDQT